MSGDVILCPTAGRRRRRLPVLTLVWLDDGAPRDVCGRRRSACTLPGYRKGQKPPNAGRRFPPTPPSEGEVLRLLEACPTASTAGRRNRALIALLWRSGLRIQEALDLRAEDLDVGEHTILVRCGKGGKTRLVVMDPWGWEQVSPWLDEHARRFPRSPVFCSVEGPTRGGPMRSAYFRAALKRLAVKARLRKRCAPHQLRHAAACLWAARGVDVFFIQDNLGHASLAVTTNYLRGMAPEARRRAILALPAPNQEDQA